MEANDDDELRKFIDDSLDGVEEKVEREMSSDSSKSEKSDSLNAGGRHGGSPDDIMNNFAKNFGTNGSNFEIPENFGSLMKDFFDNILTKNLDGLVNEDLLLKSAKEKIGSMNNSSVSALESEKFLSSLRAANLWLDSAIEFQPVKSSKIVSTISWLELTLPTWGKIINPSIKAASSAVNDNIKGFLDEMNTGSDDAQNADHKSMLGFNMNGFQGMLPLGDPKKMGSVLNNIVSTTLSSQFGSTIGSFAKSAIGSTDLLIPLLDNQEVLIPQNVRKFAKEAVVDLDEATSFLALREASGARLFNAAPWIRGYALILLENMTDGLNTLINSIDNETSSSMNISEMFGSLNQEESETTKKAKEQLGQLLVLIDTWIDHAVFRAGAPHIHNLTKMQEAFIRNRTSNSEPQIASEELLGTRPKLSLYGKYKSFWEKISLKLGDSLRDNMWLHPDTMPNTDAFENVDAFIVGNPKYRGITLNGDAENIKIDHDWDSLLK
ncbi:MAG: zinc-dependent metalloprotease [Candidatus Ancillula sp.]|jgi:putative hydrolase|nr:zinc-dependent metalloprotease [Candidatus Ancillula sp.]